MMKEFISCFIVVMLCLSTAWAQEKEKKDGFYGWGDSKEESKNDKKEDIEESTPAAEPSADEPSTEVLPSVGYPTEEIERPLVIPKETVEFRADLTTEFIKNVDNWFSLNLGTGYGAMNDVEAGIVFPLRLLPGFRAADMNLYGIYQLQKMLDDALFLAGRLDFFIPMSKNYSYVWPHDFILLPSIDAKFKLHRMFAAIGKAEMGLALSDNSQMIIGFDFGLLVQPMEVVAVSILFGCHNYLGNGSRTLLPLMIRGQYTLMGDLDLFADIGFFDLNHAGGDWFRMIVGAAYRLGL
jgi:hypothetical protein